MTNFWVRFISSVILVIVAVTAMWCGGYLLAGVLFLVSLAAYRELVRVCKQNSRVASGDSTRCGDLVTAGYLAIIAYYGVLVLYGDGMLLLLTLITVLVVFMFIYVFRFPRYHAEEIMETFFCVIYAPVMLSCIYLTRNLPNGIYLVWLIFISSWVCDTCAYSVGMLFGKHKLTPKLSPKKSVEGAVGGVVGAAAAGMLYGHFVVERWVPGMKAVFVFGLIGGVGAVIAQIGDLAASALKRNHNIKDYGTLIPGHGGIMDRFDSVIFTAPMIYLLAALLIAC